MNYENEANSLSHFKEIHEPSFIGNYGNLPILTPGNVIATWTFFSSKFWFENWNVKIWEGIVFSKFSSIYDKFTKNTRKIHVIMVIYGILLVITQTWFQKVCYQLFFKFDVCDDLCKFGNFR